MAIRVQNGSALNFGLFASAATVTHIRVQKAGTDATVKSITNVAVGANDTFVIPAGDFDVVYPSGDMTNAHMDALVRSYWDGETFQIDAMTSGTQVVSVNGYSQETHNGWTFTSEAD